MTAQSKATLAYLGLGALLPVLIQSSASIVCFRRLVGEGFTLGSGIGGRLLISAVFAIPLIVSIILTRSTFRTLAESRFLTAANAAIAFAILACFGGGFGLLAAQVQSVIGFSIVFFVAALSTLAFSWIAGEAVVARNEPTLGSRVASVATTFVAVATPVSLTGFFQVVDAVRSCSASDSWGSLGCRLQSFLPQPSY